MKKLYFIPILLLLLCLQSCETYGPASRFQITKHMETPFFNGKDTSSFYVSGRYSGGVKYQPTDKNRSGSLSLHYSKVSDKYIWTRRWLKNQYYHFAVGGSGIAGQYKVKDSLNLAYRTLSIRGEIGRHLYSDDYKIDYSFTVTLGRSYENGSFYAFRNDFEKSNLAILRNRAGLFRPFFPDSNYVSQKWSTDLGFRNNIKYCFGEYKIINLGLGVNLSINNEIAPRLFVDASYQFNKRMHLNLNYVFLPKKKGADIKSLSNFINLGVAYGF